MLKPHRLLPLAALPLAFAAVAPASAFTAAAARKEVRAAVGHPAAIHALQRRIGLGRAHAADAGGPTPDQQELAVALYDAGDSEQLQSGSPAVGPPPGAPLGPLAGAARAHLPRAHAASCWGPARATWIHTILGGAHVAQLTEVNPSWCGNGRSISFGAGNWDHKTWAQWPYCMTNVSNHQGWDRYPVWAHGGIWGTSGVYTVALVCVPILGSSHATVRVAANGYWDRYDDFGF
jgi:hypothetical protein